MTRRKRSTTGWLTWDIEFMVAKIKIPLDIVMAVLLLFEMAYHLIGEYVHKWLGIILAILFVLHHVMKWKWYKSIFRGKYSPARTFWTAANLLLTVSVIGMVLSGIMLARDIFGFIPFRADSFARLLHLSSTAWRFILIGVHIGLHGRIITNQMQRHQLLNRVPQNAMRCVVAGISLYGLYAFCHREFGARMFLTIQFAFLDFNESLMNFVRDHTAVMILCAAVSRYLLTLLALRKKKFAK